MLRLLKLGWASAALTRTVNNFTRQPEKQEICDINYRFDGISNLYQSIFEMRYGYFGKMKCCVVNSVEYIKDTLLTKPSIRLLLCCSFTSTVNI